VAEEVLPSILPTIPGYWGYTLQSNSISQEFGVYWSWRNKVRERGIRITFENLNSWNIIFKNLKYTIMQASFETKLNKVQNTVFVHHDRITIFIQGESKSLKILKSF
jgi:hypothetical protein